MVNIANTMMPDMAQPLDSSQVSASTNSLDLPPAIASLLNMGAIEPPMQNPYYETAGAMGSVVPSYQVGGQVGPGGQPMLPPGMGDQTAMPMGAQPQMQAGGQPGLAPPGAAPRISNTQLMQEAQRFAQRNPRQVQQIQMAVQQVVQSGELTIQELNTLVQLATVAMQNPEMYPQFRAMVVRENLLTEQEISQQFDPGLLFTILLLGQSLQAAPQTGGMQPVPENPAMTAGATQMGGVSGPQVSGSMPSMAVGGPLPAKSPRADGSIPIRAHEGEYVIPAHIVRAKGTEFFDKMLQTYNEDGNK
jgi:hypothetical protein